MTHGHEGSGCKYRTEVLRYESGNRHQRSTDSADGAASASMQGGSSVHRARVKPQHARLSLPGPPEQGRIAHRDLPAESVPSRRNRSTTRMSFCMKPARIPSHDVVEGRHRRPVTPSQWPTESPMNVWVLLYMDDAAGHRWNHAPAEHVEKALTLEEDQIARGLRIRRRTHAWKPTFRHVNEPFPPFRSSTELSQNSGL